MGIGIKKSGEYLDLLPGTRIQRERNSPLFIDSSTGSDSIPGEVSYPFSLPLTDKNLRLLGYPDNLPASKTLAHDIILEESGMQLSGGKLIVEQVTSNLVKNNTGQLDGYILSNASEFWQRVRDKKLSDLTLGGTRTFTWAGYSTSTAGFWKHVHDTWNYNSSADGDYVFYPAYCKQWESDTIDKWLNRLEVYSGTVEIDRDNNVNTLVPHPFLSYVLKQVFLEHGYAIEGDIFADTDFNQITLFSYRAVYWAEAKINVGVLPAITGVPIPLTSVDLKVAEHVPPEISIGNFLVELQKFLPISFLINDNAKKCRVVWVNELSGSGAPSMTQHFNPSFSLSFEKDTASAAKVVGFTRSVDDEYPISVVRDEFNFIGEVDTPSALPAPSGRKNGDVYFIRQYNRYYICGDNGSVKFWGDLGDNQDSLSFPNQTDSVDSNIVPMGMTFAPMWSTSAADAGYWTITSRRGNWKTTPDTFNPWGLRVMFYRGKKPFRSTYTAPFLSLIHI